MLNKLEKLPVPLLPASVGACTLANVYAGNGYTFIKHFTIIVATIIWILHLVKIIKYPKVAKKDYDTTLPSSLYAGFTMLMMIFGSYYYDINQTFGKSIWLIGIVIHAIHILIFTYRNILKGINVETFIPSYFVTYNGIMVSTVIGGMMKEPLIFKAVTYYGIGIFFTLIPFMIYRLIKFDLKPLFYHTQAILLAPSSLCLVCYLNITKEPNFYLVSVLYAFVFFTFIFIVYKLPSFFSFAFVPTYAGLTFPMAIGVVATSKYVSYLSSINYIELASILKQVQGVQLYLTTGIIFYFFLKMINWAKENL